MMQKNMMFRDRLKLYIKDGMSLVKGKSYD